MDSWRSIESFIVTTTRADHRCRLPKFCLVPVWLGLFLSSCSGEHQSRNALLVAEQDSLQSQKSPSFESGSGSKEIQTDDRVVQENVGQAETELQPPVNVAGAYLVEPKMNKCFHESKARFGYFDAMCGVSLEAYAEDGNAQNSSSFAEEGTDSARISPKFEDGRLKALRVKAQSVDEALKVAQGHIIGRGVTFGLSQGQQLASRKQTTYWHSSGRILVLAQTLSGRASETALLNQVELNLGFEPVVVKSSVSAQSFSQLLGADSLLRKLNIQKVVRNMDGQSEIVDASGQIANGLNLTTQDLLSASLVKVLKSGLGVLNKVFADEKITQEELDEILSSFDKEIKPSSGDNVEELKKAGMEDPQPDLE